MLGEAYFLGGQFDKAREVVGQALEISREVRFSPGSGLCHQVLGRIAQVEGALEEAQRHLDEALQTLDSIQARFETGRTRLFLASLAHDQGNGEAVAKHLKEAHSLFETLKIFKYVERTEQLAKDFGAHPSEPISH